MAHNEDRKERGPYRKKEEIAFWYPVSHDEAKAIEQAREHCEKKEGYAPPPFQMLGRIIRSYASQLATAELTGKEDLSENKQ